MGAGASVKEAVEADEVNKEVQPVDDARPAQDVSSPAPIAAPASDLAPVSSMEAADEKAKCEAASMSAHEPAPLQDSVLREADPVQLASPAKAAALSPSPPPAGEAQQQPDHAANSRAASEAPVCAVKGPTADQTPSASSPPKAAASASGEPSKESPGAGVCNAPNESVVGGSGRTPSPSAGASSGPASALTATPHGSISDVPYAQTPQSTPSEGVAVPFGMPPPIAAGLGAMTNYSQNCRPPPIAGAASTVPATPATLLPSLSAGVASHSRSLGPQHLASTPSASTHETPESTFTGQDGTPSSVQNESTKGRPGRKPKQLPPGFQRIDEGGDVKPYWLAPDKTKCWRYKDVVDWMEQHRPTVAWSGARLAVAQAVSGQLNASEVQLEARDPPEKVEDFLAFAVHYLSQANQEDEVYDLLDDRIPRIDGKHVNLCELFHKVRHHGGKEKMHMRLWQSVLQDMKLAGSKEDARAVEGVYERFLTCCESKAFNSAELRAHADSMHASEKKNVTLKTLLHRGLLRVGQRLFWAPRKGETDENLQLEGVLNEDGQIEFDGTSYKSLDKFASAASQKLGSKTKNGWGSVRTAAPSGLIKTMKQIKSDFTGRAADRSREAMLKPGLVFAGQAAKLKAQRTQSEVREQEEIERQQQLDREKSLARKPPPFWISPQDDARFREEVKKGSRKKIEDERLAKMLADLEAASHADDVASSENLLYQLIQDMTPLDAPALEDVYCSPYVIKGLAKCCWSWLCKSSLVAPHGTWQMNMHIVNRKLQTELDPRKGRVHWRHKGRFAAGAAGDVEGGGCLQIETSQYKASELPPGWRREERQPEDGRGKNANFKFYTYFAPDGKTFQRWPEAKEYFKSVLQGKSETEKRREPEKHTDAAHAAADESAAGNSGHEADAGGHDDDMGGGDSQMAEAEAGAEDDDDAEDDDEMAEDDDGHGRQQQHMDALSNAPGGSNSQQVWCSCCHADGGGDGACAVVQRAGVFGHTMHAATREGEIKAARYERLAKSYLLLLKMICRDRRGMARVGSHDATVQLLMEIVTAELPRPPAQVRPPENQTSDLTPSRNPKPETLDQRPQTVNPKPQPYCLNPERPIQDPN